MGCSEESEFRARKLGGEVGHFKRDVRHSPDEIGNRRVRFEAHPFHAEFAFLVTNDKESQMLQVRLPRLRFDSGNTDVVIPAHCFSSGRIGAKFYSIRYAFESRRAFRKHTAQPQSFVKVSMQAFPADNDASCQT